MFAPRLSPAAYRRLTGLAAIAVAFIIVTGGAVRLSGSGLGCPDWPTCASNHLVAPLQYHAMVEFVNRMITGLVSIAVVLAVLGSVVRKPRRRDLTWLSAGLVLGVIAQIILGGLTVLFHLKPQFVMSHFLLSMVILADAIVLHHRAGEPDDRPAKLVVPPELRLMARFVVATAGIAIVLGTVVTGSGPHGGDEHVKRLSFAVPTVARFHGISVMVFLGLTLATLWKVRRVGAPASLLRSGEVLMAVAVAQAAVGYLQYFTGVPVFLVGIHIAGATAVWAAALSFLLGFTTRQPTASPGAAARDPALAHP